MKEWMKEWITIDFSRFSDRITFLQIEPSLAFQYHRKQLYIDNDTTRIPPALIITVCQHNIIIIKEKS